MTPRVRAGALRPALAVEIVERFRTRRLSSPRLAAFLRRAARLAPPPGRGRVAVCLVGDATMSGLNRRWRNKVSTTDVLAFPAGDDDPEGGIHLGDLVISVPRAAAQASERGHSLAREIRILLLHGYLHLLGHDHETDDGEMLRLQRRLERSLLPQPAARRPR